MPSNLLPPVPTIPTLADKLTAPNPVNNVASYRNQGLGGLTSGLTAQTGGATPSLTPDTLFPNTGNQNAVQLGSQQVIAQVAASNKQTAKLMAINNQKKLTEGRVQGYGNVGNIGGAGLHSNYGGGGRIRMAAPQDVVPVAGGYLRKDAANAFSQMASALKAATGQTIGVEEGYRSYDRQVYLYNLYKAGKGNLAATPGTSMHGTGTAVDIKGYGGAAFNWLRQNAGKFGYSWTGGGFSQVEPWHWQYTG